MSEDETRLARIALAHLVETGNRDLGELAEQVGPALALRRLQAGEVTTRLRATTFERVRGVDAHQLAADALALSTRLGARIVTPEDDEWPRQLGDLTGISDPEGSRIDRDTYPPHCLWVVGGWRLDEVCDQSVAVVGSRASTSYGTFVASDLANGLADRGWTVVSGGAFGIDAAAHRGAMAASGVTVAVLACGVDRPYPEGHTMMFDRIAETGLVISEWPPGFDPFRQRFLIRNRVIAALTRGTVMVEAAVRSGATFTLNRARQLRRVAMAVPGPVTSAMSVGCHKVLRDGGGTILVANTDHVLDAVGRIGADLAPVERAAETPRDRLTGLERQVLDGVRPRKILSAEEIAGAARVSSRDARRTLPALVAAGFVTVVGAGYRLARPGGSRA